MDTTNRPIILIVDDEPPVLAALARDLAREYGDRFSVMRASSGAAALDALRLLALRREPVALLIADQRMPEMTGVEFLAEAMKLVPTARRVLLTAYADTQAAIRAINDVRLDHYLTKPWEPPEERLFPIVRDLLDDWQAAAAPPAETIKLVGHRWSARSHEIKDFLARNLVPYQWVDVEANEDARRLVRLAGAGPAQLPLVLFPDGANLIQPTIVRLAERLGLRMRAERASYDLVIVGAGPAGLAAAVYGASEGLRTLLIEREAPGGQAGTTSRIENYLGFPVGLSGADLTRRAVAQATRFGAEILAPQEATGVRVQDNYRVVTLSDGSEVSCEALLIATGVSYRRFETAGCDRLTGAGVYYGAAIPEALDAAGKDVFVVGGGNSAGQAAMYLSQYARSVTILVRGESLADTMSQYLIAQIEETPNIAVRTRTTVEEMLGETHLEAIRIASPAGEETLPTTAVFIYIGAVPRTEWLSGLVLRDELGFILSGTDVLRDGQPPRGWYLERDPFWLEASVPGIFVAGDVRRASVKRIASAAGEGAMAVQFVHQHLGGAAARTGRRPAPPAYVEALHASPIFSDLDDRDLEVLAEMAQPMEVPAGQVVIEEGTSGDTLYVVLDGELAVSTARGGAEAEIAILGKHEVVGEMAVLQQAPRTASVRTRVDSRLLVITQPTFLRMLMKNVGTLRAFLRTFATRLQETESRVMEQAKMAALGRLAAGLAEQLDAPTGAIVRGAAQLGDALGASDRALAELRRQEIAASAAAIAQLMQEFRTHSDGNGAALARGQAGPGIAKPAVQ